MLNSKLKKLRWGWIIWLVFLIISAFSVPYLFLSDIEKVSGAFLFWVVFALAAVLSTIRITGYWSDNNADN